MNSTFEHNSKEMSEEKIKRPGRLSLLVEVIIYLAIALSIAFIVTL